MCSKCSPGMLGPSLRAFYVDEDTIYAATSADEARQLFEHETGVICDVECFPKELTARELDARRPDFDADDRPTGTDFTVRALLASHGEAGLLACSL